MANDIQPFGLWPSPVSPTFLSQGLRLGDSAWDSDGVTLVWHEGRSDRGVLVCSRLDGNAPRDLTDELSVRAKLGYGGGDFCVGHGRIIFVANSRLYSLSLSGGKPKTITPAFGDEASPVISPDGQHVLYVFSYERKDGLAVVDIEGKIWPRKVAEGRDFYMQPRLSPDGKFAAWISWDHPNMPWDGCQLYLAEVESYPGGLPRFKNERVIAGGDQIAVFQPEFSPDGRYLCYLSDERGGWHNYYLFDLHKQQVRQLTEEKNVQLGTPAWQQGQRVYGWTNDSRGLVATRNERGILSLALYSIDSGKCEVLNGFEPFTDIVQPAVNPKRPLISAAVSAGICAARLVVGELRYAGNTIVVKRATSESLPAEKLSAPQAISWRCGNEQIHGLLYLPKGVSAGASSDPHLPAVSAPPAIIRIHGGPTSQARAAFNADAQFFCTRGYTVLDVNYRGSTGYGRDYMNALRGNWGVHDVEDAVSGASHLASLGLADSKKFVIMGGSAGGYTVLQALVTHPEFFKAGVCLYGVSNMFTLAADTHKFEERYLDSLLGPLPAAAALYRERSPIFHAEKITDPVAIFQGENDEVVPRAQSDTIVESLKRRGVPHEYHVYAGEGHGWRKAETIEKYYRTVERFLREFVLFA